MTISKFLLFFSSSIKRSNHIRKSVTTDRDEWPLTLFQLEATQLSMEEGRK